MVSLIIPAFNEQKGIKNTAQYALKFMEQNFEYFEIIVVDDGSSDSTCSVLLDTGVTLISMPQNSGKGAAVKEGIIHAEGDYVFFTDADLPYSLEFITQGIETLKNCDIVCGNRFGNYPIRRKIVSAMYNRIANNILEIGVNDVQCGIKGFTRRAANQIFSLCCVNGFAFDTEILFLARQLELDIKTLNVRVSHRSDSSVCLIGDGLQMFADVLKIRNSYEAGEYNLYKGYQR